MPKDHISSTSHKFLASSLEVITEVMAEGVPRKSLFSQKVTIH